MSKARVAIVKCDNYHPQNLKGAVYKLLELLDIKLDLPRENILLNPNLLSAKGPDRAITTHPHLVRVVADMFCTNDTKVFVGDSPGGADRGVKRIWRNTGLLESMKSSKAYLFSFEGHAVTPVQHNGRQFMITEIRNRCDFVIGLPKLKTHVLTLMTGALKNCFGFIPGFRKSLYHKELPKPYEFSEMLVDLYAATKPDLFIMDAILAMEGDGPSSGNPKKLNLLLASTDAIALDTAAASIIGFDPMKIDYLKIAAQQGLGRAELEQIDIAGEDIISCKPAEFTLPSNTKLKLIPDFLIKMISPYVWAHPAIDYDKCINCHICRDSCPVKAISEDGDKLVYDYSKCIDCMCCHELCPNEAIYLKKSWLVKKFIS